MSEAVIRRNVPADPACGLGLVDLLVHEVRESFRIDLSTRQAGQDLTSQHLTQNATYSTVSLAHTSGHSVANSQFAIRFRAKLLSMSIIALPRG